MKPAEASFKTRGGSSSCNGLLICGNAFNWKTLGQETHWVNTDKTDQARRITWAENSWKLRELTINMFVCPACIPPLVSEDNSRTRLDEPRSESVQPLFCLQHLRLYEWNIIWYKCTYLGPTWSCIQVWVFSEPAMPRSIAYAYWKSSWLCVGALLPLLPRLFQLSPQIRRIFP